jgi:hypothetical protein
VPEDQRQVAGLDLAVAQVQIGPAHAAGLHLEQHLAAAGLGDLDVVRPQRLARLVEQHRAHQARSTSS